MCGIWAIINQEEVPFDYQSFCTLGCANDARGGDSCGIFIDGAVEYGIGNKALFENFFWSSELLNTTQFARILLGHDRKASVGGITLEKAHPIVIYETVKISEEESREEVKFVLIHNGTIYNYEELAKKYIPDIDIKNMSDSQVLARLLYYSGFDFLAEYNGGAAFIAVDYRKEEPEIFVWRGESKKYDTSKEVEEERPLYCNLDNGRLILSSIPSYLQICDGNCYIVPGNEVLTYKEGKFYIVKKIDRSKVCQSKEVKTTSYAYASGYYSSYGCNKYMIASDLTNTYKVGSELLDGYVRMTSYGKILGKYDSYSSTERQHCIWFFNGIPLKDKKAYKFLTKAMKIAKLEIAEFVEKYQNLIRYFSTDQLYPHEKVMYQAVEPFKRVLFSGYHQMLSNANCDKYLLGIKQVGSKVTDIYSSFLPLDKVPSYDYKTIWKEFIQSMG